MSEIYGKHTVANCRWPGGSQGRTLPVPVHFASERISLVIDDSWKDSKHTDTNRDQLDEC